MKCSPFPHLAVAPYLQIPEDINIQFTENLLCVERFIKKEGVVITTLARYLLGEKCGNRLKTIDELANECRSSVGLTQAALKTLESSGAIRIERRGRNGSYLVEMDNKALLTHVDINNVVCAMPLPYTRLYEGLASGLKAQFDGIPFYYAHMRGADIRVECLLNGVYDMAVVSRLAAESYLTQKAYASRWSWGRTPTLASTS